MPPILSHLSYFFISLVGPALFASWLLTGPEPHHGFYNLYATYVVVCTTYVAAGILMLWLNEAQNKAWRFEKSRELLRSKTYITYFSYFTSVVIFVTLVWYGKFVIGGILILHVLLTALIRHMFLGSPAHPSVNPPVAEPQLGTVDDESKAPQPE